MCVCFEVTCVGHYSRDVRYCSPCMYFWDSHLFSLGIFFLILFYTACNNVLRMKWNWLIHVYSNSYVPLETHIRNLQAKTWGLLTSESIQSKVCGICELYSIHLIKFFSSSLTIFFVHARLPYRQTKVILWVPPKEGLYKERQI